MNKRKNKKTVKQSVAKITNTIAKSLGTPKKMAKRSLTPREPVKKRLLDSYVASLNNPFEFQPPQFGFESFCSSATTQAYQRGAFPVGSDGTFGIILGLDYANYFVGKKVAGISSPDVTWSGSSNSTIINLIMGSCRPVSGGIKAFTLAGSATTTGLMYAGTSPSVGANILAGQTISALTGYPDVDMSAGTEGASAFLRPSGPRAFEYIEDFTALGSADQNFCIPFIVGTGFPAGTSIGYEAVINYEYLPRQDQRLVNPPASTEPTLADFFPSVESVVKAASRSLLPSYVADALEGVINVGKQFFGRPNRQHGNVHTAMALSSWSRGIETIEASNDRSRGRISTAGLSAPSLELDEKKTKSSPSDPKEVEVEEMDKSFGRTRLSRSPSPPPRTSSTRLRDPLRTHS